MSLDVYLELNGECVYSDNITHNLNEMAAEAGIYKELWRPEECEIKVAHQLIEPLTSGLKFLLLNSDSCKKLNPSNGWGDHGELCSFTFYYIQACILYPTAEVTVSR